MKRRSMFTILIALTLMVLFVFTGCGKKNDPIVSQLPEFITFSTYDIGTATYTQMAAVCEGLLKNSGIKTRQLTSGTDFGRIIPVKTGKAHFLVATGNTAYLATEGKGEFENYEWGPQDLRLTWIAFNKNTAGTLITAADANIKTPYDLKGKRFYYIVGSPSSNLIGEAILKYANLTWDDVVKVEMPGLGAAYKSIAEGKADAGPGGITSPTFFELASSPRGLYLPEFPVDDKDGWKRINEFAPGVYRPVKAITGAGVSPEQPRNLINYAYPVVLTYPEQDEEVVYTITKAFHESYDQYKDMLPELREWKLEDCIIPENMFAPFHSGAVKYFKEIGWWNEKLEERQTQLLERQEKLKDIWNESVTEAQDQKIKAADYPKYWQEKRELLN